jgi:hypothetical protein
MMSYIDAYVGTKEGKNLEDGEDLQEKDKRLQPRQLQQYEANLEWLFNSDNGCTMPELDDSPLINKQVNAKDS